MDLIEFDAKRLLRNAGLPVPGGARLLRPADEPSLSCASVLKAQLRAGGRGKAGLVRLIEPAEAEGALADIRTRLVASGEAPLVMVEDQVAFDQECYLGWRIDDVAQAPVLMFSPLGGVEIESRPESVRHHRLPPLAAVLPHHLLPFLREAGAPLRALGPIARFAADLYGVFRAQDATLVEINPLAVAANGVVALDCKMSVDGNAGWRHGAWHDTTSFALRHAGMTELEARADRDGVTFVEMEGNVALLSSGAGLGMALVDLLAASGLRAGCFCDTAGGSGEDAFRRLAELAFDRAEASDIQAIAAFFTLSATSLKPAVTTLLDIIATRMPGKPIVIGFAATGPAEREMTVAAAREAFAALGYPCVDDPDDLVCALHDAMS